jgi:predicted SAM-dependent methyltransferase
MVDAVDDRPEVPAEDLIRLNLGCGDAPLTGYRNIDRKLGTECYPLPDDIADESVDEIRASHVLEHFAHGFVHTVLIHWAAKLKPGGRMRLSVPDFHWIARNYLDKKPINVQGYTMGGQTDPNDFHHAIFDFEALAEQLRAIGLERIQRFESDAEDCSSLDCSLNVEGTKPIKLIERIDGVRAILGVPRFGPLMHARCGFEALSGLGIPLQIAQGCFWNQILSEGIEKAIDYDTIYTRQDVIDLYRTMEVYPWIDALASLQAKRGAESVLFALDKEGGELRTLYRRDFQKLVTKIRQAHFGLTILRADRIRDLKRPWMLARPDGHGRWGDDRTDADVVFWRNWEDAGCSLYLANRVVVGHMEEVITWPGRDMKPVHQSITDYSADGKPVEAFR